MCIRDREFIDYVKERLAAYKYPRIVEVIPEMPKSATGKILSLIHISEPTRPY